MSDAVGVDVGFGVDFDPASPSEHVKVKAKATASDKSVRPRRTPVTSVSIPKPPNNAKIVPVPTRTIYRSLSIAHFVVASPLVLLSTFFGLILAPILAAGPVWLCILGSQLWNGSDAWLCVRLRITHAISLFFAALLCAFGLWALQAGERSAAHGGGLLSAWGLIPLLFGCSLGLLSMLTLLLVRPAVNAAKSAA